ncbi:MAG: helix-turn-helix transcriptional regulator, partial [bacterium]|nr:helix-turn-helix transcriptional regulator [bacterium]
MSKQHVKALRIKAAEETIKRLQRDRERVSAQVKPLVKYIEDHLFDSGLQTATIIRGCGIRDRSISSQFTHQLELTPWKYVTDCRMEVAARMLLNSNLEP